jgi:hypothetical protein
MGGYLRAFTFCFFSRYPGVFQGVLRVCLRSLERIEEYLDSISCVV